MLTDQQHPITPPPELVEQWRDQWIDDAAEDNTQDLGISPSFMVHIATQAARWGADQELEACCEWLSVPCPSYGRELRAARRPKPPSLAEQALKALQDQIDTSFKLSSKAQERVDLICAALERLQELESNG